MDNKRPLRLASYNVRKCVGLDRRRRPLRIIEVLNGLDAHVVALQEADRRLGERPAALPARLIEEETDFRFVPIADSGPSVGWHGNAVLVRKDIATGQAETIELPGTEPRGAVSVRLGDGLRVVATHLGLLRSDRRRQLGEIARRAARYREPVVILGDFNEWSKKRGLEPLARNYSIQSPGRSFHAVRPVAGLDRLALGAGLQLRDAGVHETALSRVASDHLPVWGDIARAG